MPDEKVVAVIHDGRPETLHEQPAGGAMLTLPLAASEV
jgi:hypothetical protein